MSDSPVKLHTSTQNYFLADTEAETQGANDLIEKLVNRAEGEAPWYSKFCLPITTEGAKKMESERERAKQAIVGLIHKVNTYYGNKNNSKLITAKTMEIVKQLLAKASPDNGLYNLEEIRSADIAFFKSGLATYKH